MPTVHQRLFASYNKQKKVITKKKIITKKKVITKKNVITNNIWEASPPKKINFHNMLIPTTVASCKIRFTSLNQISIESFRNVIIALQPINMKSEMNTGTKQAKTFQN